MTPRGAALRARMQVDGTWLATADVMRSPELPALLTYEGPLPDTRYPQRPSATMRTAASVSDPAHLRGIRAHLVAKRPIRSEVRTRGQARFILRLLRATLGPSGIMGWSEARDHLARLRGALRAVRRLAGERGQDRRLARLFGGEL